MTDQSASGAQDDRDRDGTADDEVKATADEDPSQAGPPQAEDGRSAPDEDERVRHSEEWEAGWSGP